MILSNLNDSVVRKVPTSSLEAEEQLLSISLSTSILAMGFSRPKLSSPFCTAQGEYRLSLEGDIKHRGNSTSES